MKAHRNCWLVAAAMTLAVCGVVPANADDDDLGCSDSTLHGLYVFNASGFNIVQGVAQPKAIVELIRFNGDGTLTVPAATVSINGTIARSPANGVGTYTLGPDCTGRLAFGPPGPMFDLFAVAGGSQVRVIQTGPGSPVLQGIFRRLSN
jgi:hypothetical protein